jgi:transketolase
MLLYAMLYLAQVRGVKSEYEHWVNRGHVDDIAVSPLTADRHPEYRWTAGVETTTGPLGQGVGNSVGVAIAGKWLAAHFNQPSFEIFDYNVYAICGDGDMMEGVASEAASLAGHLKLSNLCWIYDENHVTLDAPPTSFTEDVQRFEGRLERGTRHRR